MADKAVIVGSLRSLTIDGREFPVDAASDAVFDTGGFSNTVEVTGSGESIVSQERIPWSLQNVDLVISEDRGDLGFLASVFNAIVEPFAPSLAFDAPPTGPDRAFLGEVITRATFRPILVTLVDGLSYSGRGTILGSVPVSTRTGLARMSFAGDGEMTKIEISRPSLLGLLL
jgi:hypothetical protein